MAFNIADVLNGVSVLDTDKKQEKIEYIGVEEIKPSEQNFYSLEGIEELAGNIELCGLQQPLRVKENEFDYTIISGHRRFAAIKLISETSDMFKSGVPCIIEQCSESEAMTELKLIMANNDTRKMSSADIQQQAKRVSELLYKLSEEEGVEFPGRMRDYVSKIVGVSKTKLARLSAIDNNLSDFAAGFFKTNDLSESVAYRLSQLPEDDQNLILRTRLDAGKEIKNLTETQVEAVEKAFKRLRESKCGVDGSDGCQCLDRIAKRLVGKQSWDIYNCQAYKGTGCCSTCFELQSCLYSCDKVTDKKTQLKEQAKELRREEKQKKEDELKPKLERITRLWERFATARAAAGISVKDYFDAINIYYSNTAEKEFLEHERGERLTTEYNKVGEIGALYELDRYVNAADVLNCSIDYLLGRSKLPMTADELAKRETVSGTDTGWHKVETDGLPTVSGLYLANFGFSYGGAELKYKPAKFDSVSKDWYFYYTSNYGAPNTTGKINAKCVSWMIIPEAE